MLHSVFLSRLLLNAKKEFWRLGLKEDFVESLFLGAHRSIPTKRNTLVESLTGDLFHSSDFFSLFFYIFPTSFLVRC